LKRVIFFLSLWFFLTIGLTNLIIWHEIKKNHPEGSLFVKIRNSISKVLKHTEIDGSGINIIIGNNNGNGSNNSSKNNGINVNFGNINVGNGNGNDSNNSGNNSGYENNTSDNY